MSLGPATGIAGTPASPPLYTTVVGTDAQMAAALTSDGGDTFIKAGAYTVDLNAIGALNTTPRTFWGAGSEKVVITLLAPTVPAALDFSASLGSTTGVLMHELTVTSASALVGPGLIMGLNGGSGLRAVGTAGVTANGFFGCFNLVNCQSTGLSGVAGGAGFSACIGIANCTADDFSSSAFAFCARMSGCTANALPTVGVLGDDAGYSFCSDVVGCIAGYTAVTSVAVIHHAMRECEQVSGCEVNGPVGAPGGVGTLEGVTGGNHYSGVDVTGKFDIGFATTLNIGACLADACVTNGFESCSALSGCTGQNNGNHGFASCNSLSACIGFQNTLTGFFTCLVLSGCHAITNTTNGFDSCTSVSGSDAIDNGAIGFAGCTELAGVTADSNVGNGFNACIGIASANATGNTGFGYAAACDRVSSARASAPNTAGLSDLSNTAVDAATAVGI